jgi:hypothetical protein
VDDLRKEEVSAIPLAQEDLEDLVGRQKELEFITSQREALELQAQRLARIAEHLLESLTAKLAQKYHLDVEHEAWQVDLEGRRLVRVAGGKTGGKGQGGGA